MSHPLSNIIIIFAVVFLFSQKAVSGQIEDGYVAYKQGDIELAKEKLLPLAIKGSAIAQFLLSDAFDKQPDSPENIVNAKRWLTASANNGFLAAQYNLGNNFRKGKYGSANNKMAEYWWSQAAIQGFPKAQYHLATIYYWGKRGVKRDLKEALYWFEQASNGGLVDARDALLRMRNREPLAPVSKDSSANIAHDDAMILSKLSLDQQHLKLVSQPEKQLAVEQEKTEIETSKSKVQPKQNNSDKALTNDSKPSEDTVFNATAPVPVSNQQEKDWASQQPPGNYTIQLLASAVLQVCDSQSKRVLESSKLKTHKQLFMRNGKRYCAVIYGSYRSYSQAKSSLSQLPRGIRKARPWIRQIAR
jgi:TPR repeat protein